jgi:hypothetical protein
MLVANCYCGTWNRELAETYSYTGKKIQIRLQHNRIEDMNNVNIMLGHRKSRMVCLDTTENTWGRPLTMISSFSGKLYAGTSPLISSSERAARMLTVSMKILRSSSEWLG